MRFKGTGKGMLTGFRWKCVSLFRKAGFCFLAMFATQAAAELIDRGNGLIYDSVQDLTWTQNGGLSGFRTSVADAVAWAENLVYGGFDDWRLPTTTQFDDPTCSADIRNAGDFNLWFEHRASCTGGEMEMLTALYDPWNNPIFYGINSKRYWTSTPYRDGVDPCINSPNYDVPCNINNDDGDRTGFYWQWGFTGFQDVGGPLHNIPYKTTLDQFADRYAWAVRDGDVIAQTDSDSDGVVDTQDDCPTGETGWTSTPETDIDGDGCRDATEDTDDDNDTYQDGNDNCPATSNPDQSDTDGDGAGDACDVCPDDSQDLCVIDLDNDSYTADVDCDDNDASIFPAAMEICDGADNNCDAIIDEGCCSGGAPGDMDGDGDVDLGDLLLLQRQLLELQ